MYFIYTPDVLQMTLVAGCTELVCSALTTLMADCNFCQIVLYAMARDVLNIIHIYVCDSLHILI